MAITRMTIAMTIITRTMSACDVWFSKNNDINDNNHNDNNDNNNGNNDNDNNDNN